MHRMQRRRAAALVKAREFEDWLTAWRRAEVAETPPLASTGARLASERRAALKDLIELDPKRALELAVPAGLRRELPLAVAVLLEERIDDRGELEVSVWHRGDAAHYDRVARINSRAYRAFVFGRRANQPSKSGLPLHGVAIDDALAVDEMPYRLLDDAEKAGASLAVDAPALVVGPELLTPATAAEFVAMGKALGGASGGYVSSKKPIVEWLRQRSRPYLFSNTLAPAIAGASLKVLDLLAPWH